MSSDESLSLVQPKTHHIKQELCLTRPQYRQGRKLTAVKVCLIAHYIRVCKYYFQYLFKLTDFSLGLHCQ